MNKIQNLEIFTDNNIMHMKFALTDNNAKNSSIITFNKILKINNALIINTDTEKHETPWYDIHPKFDIQLIDGDLIHIREKNNPKGIYGYENVLSCIPVLLVTWDIINQDECFMFNSILQTSPAVMQRTEEMKKNQMSLGT